MDINIKQTACPLDCFDACKVIYSNNKLKPANTQITNNKLCRLFGYLQNETNLYDENLNQTLDKVFNILNQKNKKILYYKGSGNMGVMQHITKKLFENLKATFAVGSTCDASGETGILMGRKYNVNPTIDDLLKSEVIMVWGRNFTQTSSHIYNLVKDKIFITIDPIKTEIATLSDVFLQIIPKADFQLAQILIDALDGKTLNTDQLSKLNITKQQIKQTINLIKNKKVSVMLGIGAQKYKEGAIIFHQMDKLFNKLKLFENRNTGVWYLSNSAYPFNNKISTKYSNICTYADVRFDDFDIVFIQGANPVISAPNQKRTIKALQNSFVIYFGTTKNETAQYANIIIPAKTFLQKKDVRLSYGHDEIMFCDICQENNKAISEYDFTKYMFDRFDFDGLLEEDQYLDCFKTIANPKPNIKFEAHKTKNVPLLNIDDNQFYLITSKSTNALNSQFKSDPYAYINPKYGFKDDQVVTISSKVGTIQIKIKNDPKVCNKAILIYASNKQVNILTSEQLSDCQTNATFQDIILTII